QLSPIFSRNNGDKIRSSRLSIVAHHVRSRGGARSGRKQSRTTEAASARAQTQEDADLECWERSQYSPGSAGTLESPLLLHCADWSSGRRVAGALSGDVRGF